jgi:hypothetical protein
MPEPFVSRKRYRVSGSFTCASTWSASILRSWEGVGLDMDLRDSILVKRLSRWELRYDMAAS